MKSFRRHLTYANVMSSLAVFLLLGGGMAVAAGGLGKNTVGTKQLKKNAVTAEKVKDGSLLGADFAAGQLPAGPAGPAGAKGATGATGPAGATGPSGSVANSVTSASVLDDTAPGGGLNSEDFASNSVDFAEIKTDAVQATEIADNSIDAGEIVDFGLSNEDVGVLFAEVAATGTLDNSSGGVTSEKMAGFTGNYEVDFGRNITSCTSVATVGPSGGGSATGEINVADRGGNAEAVFVDTNDSTGAAVDKPFRLIVVC